MIYWYWQVQVTSNQLKRQEDECRHLKEELETKYLQNKELQSKMKDERRKYSDLESRLKEDSVHARIKDAEKSQVNGLDLIIKFPSWFQESFDVIICCYENFWDDKSSNYGEILQRMFDLSQQISSLKLKNQELLAEKELSRDRCISSNGSDKSDSEMDTQDRIKELRDTIDTLSSQIEKLEASNVPVKKQSTTSSEGKTSPDSSLMSSPKENGHGSSMSMNANQEISSSDPTKFTDIPVDF